MLNGPLLAAREHRKRLLSKSWADRTGEARLRIATRIENMNQDDGRADQKQNGARQSARSSANTYIRCVYTGRCTPSALFLGANFPKLCVFLMYRSTVRFEKIYPCTTQAFGLAIAFGLGRWQAGSPGSWLTEFFNVGMAFTHVFVLNRALEKMRTNLESYSR